jgi:hypothetical protein
MPTGWRSTYLVVTWSKMDLVGGGTRKEMDTSKDVPKILSLTKDMAKEECGAGNKKTSVPCFFIPGCV